MNHENLEELVKEDKIILNEGMVTQLKEMVISDDDNDFTLACGILKQLDFNNESNQKYYIEIIGKLVLKWKKSIF